MGPNIKPCGIPEKVFEKHYQCHVVLHLCFLHFKYECTKVTAPSDKPYA